MKKFLFILSTLFILISCNSDSAKTKSCQTIDDCPTTEYCINNICQKDSKECDTKDDCSNDFYCNRFFKCVKDVCLDDDYCGSDKICKEEICVTGCRLSSDCKDGKICKDDRCIEKPDCRDDNVDCEAGYKCNIGTGDCEVSNSCQTDTDCPSDYKCDMLSCVEKKRCTESSECEEGEFCTNAKYCDIDTGNCDSNQYCIDKFGQFKPFCNELTGVCNECIDDNHCPGDVICLPTHKCDMPICDRVTCPENSVCDPLNGDCLCEQGFKRENGVCIDICSSITCEYDNQSCIVNDDGEAECIKTCYQDSFSTPLANYDRAHATPIRPGVYGPAYKYSCSYEHREGYCGNKKMECDNGVCKYKPSCTDRPCTNSQTCVDGYCYDNCSAENFGKYGYCADESKMCDTLGACVNSPICTENSQCAEGELCLGNRCDTAPLSLIALNCDYVEDWYSIELTAGQKLKVEIHYNSSGVHDKTIEIHSVYNGFLVRSENHIDRVDASVEYTAMDSITHFIKIYNSFRNNEDVGYSMRVSIE